MYDQLISSQSYDRYPSCAPLWAQSRTKSGRGRRGPVHREPHAVTRMLPGAVRLPLTRGHGGVVSDGAICLVCCQVLSSSLGKLGEETVELPVVAVLFTQVSGAVMQQRFQL